MVWCALLCNQLSIIHHKLLSCRCATGGKHPWALSGEGLPAKSEISADRIFSQPLCCSAVNFSWILFMEGDHLTGSDMISAHICHPRPRPDCKSNFIFSRSTVQHFHFLLQEHYLGPGLVLGHLPEDRRLCDEHERGDQGDRCLPHQDRDQAQGHGGEDEDLVQRSLGLLGPALGREDGGVEKGLSDFLPPTTSDMATNDGSFRLRATLTKSTARSTRSCGRN